jgi:hypothetical protein
VLALVARYQAFATHSQALAKAGVNFLEIAGNREVILVSAIVPATFDDSGLKVIMKQPILTRPGYQRIAFTVSVSELAAMLRRWDKPPFQLEHVYDY